MSDDRPKGLPDRIVERLARWMNALGLNGTRLLWKWNRKRAQLGEGGLKAEILWRSARGKHKMCRSCRALVDRSAKTCPECDASLSGVRAPGLGRLLANIVPGASNATSLVLLVNGFWFLMMLLAQARSGGSGGGFSLFSFFDGKLLLDFGSGYSPLTLAGEWWRIVTPIFLHAGLIHFFFNSYMLLQLGSLAEEEFGTQRFWVLYLACGIGGSLTSQWLRAIAFGSGVNTVGASGAIMGLMGLLLVHGWRRGDGHGEQLKRMMIRFGLYMLVFSLLFPRLDHFSHGGGFLCGAILGALIPSAPARRRESQVWGLAALAGVLLVLVSFFEVARHR